jgi:hypothetical protein
MKNALLVLMALINVTIGMAQDDKGRTEQEFKTIFNGNPNNNIIHGGYGGIMMNYTRNVDY